VTQKWYARKSDTFLYDQPRAAPWQVERARTLLERKFVVPLNDFDAHLGALTMLKDHLRERLWHAHESELIHRVQASCRRPGFDIKDPLPSHHGAGHWMWIDPATIARGLLGASFSPYHYSVEQLAFLAEKVLLEQGNPDGLAQLFGHPRSPEPAVVVNSMPGPFGPVRTITVNGNHRTLIFEAVGAPLILAKVHRYRSPYRCKLRLEDDWRTTLVFLRWLESFKVLRLSSRAVVSKDPWVYLRVAEAPIPWLAASPQDALAALATYEQFYGRRIERIGPLDRRLLQRQWGSVRAAQG